MTLEPCLICGRTEDPLNPPSQEGGEKVHLIKHPLIPGGVYLCRNCIIDLLLYEQITSSGKRLKTVLIDKIIDKIL